MKKTVFLLLALLTVFSCYDDSALQETLKEHEERISALETLCAQLNTNITALQTVVSALENNVYVTAVTPVKEGDDIIGYTISFTNSESVTIYNSENGTDGKDGASPLIGVRQDADGIYYWTLNGEWLTDSAGNKVRASAQDGADGKPGEPGIPGAAGVTPKLKIVDGYWYVSYDGGKTWEEQTLGQATGDSGYTMFAEVTYDDKNVYITMADGEKLTLPRRPAEDGGSGESGEGEDAIANSFAGVSLTLSLRNLAEGSVVFYGEAVFEDDNKAESFGILYSTEPEFTVETATNLPIVNIYGTSYSLSTRSLKPNTTYYYTSFIKKGVYKYGEVKSFTTPSIVAPTLNEASDITEGSAVISGTVTPYAAEELEYGFQYCKSEDFSSGVVSKKITDVTSENTFSMQITSLVPMTTYYYRSYIKMNGVYGYGDVMSFTAVALVAPTLNEASDITEGSAVISGTVTPALYAAEELEYGFQYCTSQDFASNVVAKEVAELDSENTFSMQISSLMSGQSYYVRSYIQMNGATVYSDVKLFTTLQHPYEVQSDLNTSAATDLSSSGSANCYIISVSGLYKFKTVKGSSNESVGSVAWASILWETFGTDTTPEMFDLISGFCYKDGYIAFQTADTFKEGNAVIAAKDASGKILWSWHIWFTDEPQGQEYYNNAGTMMDRNLGATSATPGDVGALGLLYQWGRKDPFLGSSSISDEVVAESTITWPSSVESDSSNGTIAYATAHPTTFITYNSNNYDWYYTGDLSTDNTRWTTSESSKSIYDPCPVGWRVPDGGDNGIWCESSGSSLDNTYDSTNAGMNFSGKFGSASTIWYPGSGCRDYDDGSLFYVGYGGLYWSASPIHYRAYGLLFRSDCDIFPSFFGGRADGNSVRCLRE